MTTTAANDYQIVPQQASPAPALRATDQGVSSSLEAVLSDNTRRTYDTQWRIFTGWCYEVGLRPLPAEPFTVARYLAARAGSGASIATLRLATSAISKGHEWAKLESPCQDPGVRASISGAGPVSRGPGGGPLRRRPAPVRGFISDLGRRAALR